MTPLLHHLVGGFNPSPLKVNWDDDIPNIWKNKKRLEPPTSHQPTEALDINLPSFGLSEELHVVEAVIRLLFDLGLGRWNQVRRWKTIGKPSENHRKTIGKP